MAAKLRVPHIASYGLARLDNLLSGIWGRRLGLIVAPAGSGKTTLLSRFAANARVPVAWYRCEPWDFTQDHLLRHLDGAFARALGTPTQGWRAIDQAISDLDRLHAGRMVLVIDDEHSIAGTPAEVSLERFVEYAPPDLLTLVASRWWPRFNVPRLRVSNALGEITGEDLRFRSWEVDSLFRDFYREPLPPVELAELARRTEGWAAGLQLFHLATSRKGAGERRRILGDLAGGSRLVREYLTRNVLDELPAVIRDFLLDTCVLGRLSAQICDQFLNRDDSGHLLQELEERQIFTTAVGDDGDYRYHEVLRSHLEHELMTGAGERALRVRYSHAGAVLEEFEAIPEALHAFCRAEDWTAVDRLLGRNGAQLAQCTGTWIDALPAVALEHDPWLLLASARRHRAEGRWRDAVDTYQRAERGFAGAEPTQICQREHHAVALWLSPTPPPALGSHALLRLATMRDPLGIRAQLVGHEGSLENFVAGVSSLLAGETLEAQRLLSLVAQRSENGDAISVAGRLAADVAAMLTGAPDVVIDLELTIEEADSRGLGFIARIARACRAITPGPVSIADAIAARQVCERIGDPWGAAIAGLIQGWCLLHFDVGTAGPASVLAMVADEFHDLGAGVLEAWGRGLLALALAKRRGPAAKDTALKAESLANGTGVEGPKVFIYLALAMADPAHASQFLQLAKAIRAQTGLSPHLLETGSEFEATRELQLSIRCFGEFQILISGQPLKMANMKPRTRALLRRLSVDAGKPVHREVLQDVFWPDADPEAAARNLHVAISSLRQALEPGVARRASSLLIREGDSYRLVLPPGSNVDVQVFDQALEQSRRARLAGDVDGALLAFKEAAQLADKDLLPEEGSAEWVIYRRDRARAGILDVARPLAGLLLLQRQPALAADVCSTALNVDRYDDALWRFLIESREKTGDKAGARRAQAEYRRILLDLERGSN